jgi:nicotinamidase-related amidase
MPVTTVDERVALVLIDLQHGIVGLAERFGVASGETVATAAALAEAFRSRDLPVILVRVAFSADGADVPRNRTTVPRSFGDPPANWAEIVPELKQTATDLLVTKRQPGAFYGTDLDLQLRRRGITNIVLGGISTSAGVEATARSAFDHGYNVTFAADAMADLDPASHTWSVEKIFPKLGEVDTTDVIVRKLDQRTA